MDDGKPIPDSLIRDLTAHRTLGLRLALGEQPDMALLALTHAMVAQLFYHTEASCLQMRATGCKPSFGGFGDPALTLRPARRDVRRSTL